MITAIQKRIAWHVCFWIVYLLLNTRLQTFAPEEDVWRIIKGEALTLPAKMLLTYFVFYWIIPGFLKEEKRWLLLLQLIVGFSISILVYRWAMISIAIPVYFPEELAKSVFFDTRDLWWTGWDIFITVAAAATIKLFRLYNRSRIHEQELTKEKLQSELNFLRAQTNPHFLFNTLNNLYGLARKKSPKTPDAIMMLSKIMRFMLDDCEQPRIPLSEEVKIVRDYMELEKLRFNERLKVNYEEQLDEPDKLIAPLLLLPFVENAFKHGGKGTTGEATISIKIQLLNNDFQFTVENNLEPDSPREKEGIGLINVKRQLELIYPGKHELEILAKNELFRIVLSINLSEN